MLYWVITKILEYLAPSYLAKRHQRGKENSKSCQEKLGYYQSPRAKGRLIWIHGSSLGEIISSIGLIDSILAAYPTWHILITSTSLTSERMLQKILPRWQGNVSHHFLCLDLPSAVERFYQHWTPNLAIFMESEIWPNLFQKANKHNIPLIILNARLSKNSFKAWKRWGFLLPPIIPLISICLCQDRYIQNMYQKLGAKKTYATGNLKFSSPALPYQPDELADIQSYIGNRPCWLAASTHPAEEEVILRIAQRLARQFPDLLTVLAPRHPERGQALQELCDAHGISAHCRSYNKEITDDTHIYIADTIGEMGLWYRSIPIVFMGKSLFTPGGGQNPIEALQFSQMLLSGPFVSNFENVYHILSQHNLATICQNEDDIYEHVCNYLVSSPNHQARQKIVKKIFDRHGQAMKKSLHHLKPYFEALYEGS